MRARNRIISMCAVLLVLAVAGFAAGLDRPTPAGAFGSVDISLLGQKAVHEKITRSLGCAADAPVPNCLQPLSLDVLAGRSGTFGAVGEPDNPLDGLPNPSARHCDNIDYGYTSYQSIEEAQVSFDNCLEWFQSYMDFSVTSAAQLLKADGTIDPAATNLVNSFGSTSNSCSFPDPKKGNTSNDSAKCNVLNGLGRALHAYEDVWSHSNWGDQADPSKPIDLTNPTGLGNVDQPSFMSYPGPRTGTIPEGLISGCDDSISKSDCKKSASGSNGADQFRTGHSVLNKDNGDVTPTSCSASNSSTVRGKVAIDGVTNFQRAVTGACGAAKRAWSDLQNALIAKYGTVAASSMIRAITHDQPLTECAVSGSAAKASSPPVGDVASARTVTILVVNSTSSPLNCGAAVLDGGEWASYPPDVTAAGATGRWRTQSNGFATGTEGNATLRIGSTSASVTIRWSNPYWGKSAYTCDAPTGYTCSVSTATGSAATLTATVAGG